jgi:hypothetical protein
MCDFKNISGAGSETLVFLSFFLWVLGHAQPKQVSFSQARIAEAVRDYQDCCAQLYDVPITAAVHVL